MALWNTSIYHLLKKTNLTSSFKAIRTLSEKQRLLSARNTSVKELTYFRQYNCQHDFHDFHQFCSTNLFWRSPQTQLQIFQSNHASFNQLCTFWIWIVLVFVFHQASLSHPRRAPAAWNPLSPLWPTAVASTEPFMWTSWAAASRPSTAPDVALKCFMACLISKGPRPSRYSANRWRRRRPLAAWKLCRGNRPFGLSPGWVCWGSRGRRTTASRVRRVGWLITGHLDASFFALPYKANHLSPSNAMLCNNFYYTN